MFNADVETAELGDELIDLIGKEAVIALADEYAGTRLYVPNVAKEGQKLVPVIGYEAASKMGKRYGRASLRIPLFRELRAMHYREQGMSNGKIAVRLGLTETSVERLFKRLAQAV